MKTTVVNLRKSSYDIYIGRPGHGQSGYFGNPVKIDQVCEFCGELHCEGASTLVCFRAYFECRVESDHEFRKNVLGLKGKMLGCFCKPKACHGDIICEWVNEHTRDEE